MSKERYGIVYMGSKEKVLNLIDYIFQREYKKKTFIDLFTGGFSVSSYALQHTKFKVMSNDINEYVIALYREILSGSSNLNEVKYDWVSRSEFENVCYHSHQYEDWYVGYVLNVWSFGCNQKDYLYAKDLEMDKMALHQAIVYDDFSLIEENLLFDGFFVPLTITTVDFKKHPNKRLAFMNHFKQYIKSQETLDCHAQLSRMTQMESLSQMVHLDAIHRNIRYSEKLMLYNEDWETLYDMIPDFVLNEAFIYCDPPYENTKKYQFGSDFDYVKFWNWFRNCPYSVYVSSYTAPEDIKPINFALKQVNLDNGKRTSEKVNVKKKAIENIYWNGKGNAEPTFLDNLFKGDKNENKI